MGRVDLPVVITHSCADACAEAFGLPGRDQAREWLDKVVAQHGRVTDQLPKPVAGRRSPSGRFLVVDGLLVLPLAADREGRAQWIATNCVAFPPKEAADVSRLRGWELLDQVNVLPHAVERFQQRGGGDRDPRRAHEQLLSALAPTARVAKRPPAWCSTRPADLYLVAGEGDEFCLPCRPSGGPRAYDLVTCIHRAGDLFATKHYGSTSAVLPGAFAAHSRAARLVEHGLARGGVLTWTRPRYAPEHPEAKWWLDFGNRTAAPVRWQPGAARPLLVIGLVDKRPWPIRLLDRLRGW